MRTRLRNTAEVAHMWAAQTQTEGRAGNVFFDGASIYSYGRHSEIARHVAGAVLFTTRDYSVSTSKHKRDTARAVNHKRIFTVPSFISNEDNGRHYLARIEERRSLALAALTQGDYHRGYLESVAREAADYVFWARNAGRRKLAPFSSKTARALGAWIKRHAAGELFTKEELEKLDARKARAAVAEAKREEKAKARRALEAEVAREKLDAWARGEDGAMLPGAAYWAPVRLRLKDRRIETSHGAQITLRTAVELWRALLAGEDVNGRVLDNYTIAGWDGITLTVGRHKITAVELARMARALGLAGELPAVVGAL